VKSRGHRYMRCSICVHCIAARARAHTHTHAHNTTPPSDGPIYDVWTRPFKFTLYSQPRAFHSLTFLQLIEKQIIP
jgi:hypothetical protein